MVVSVWAGVVSQDELVIVSKKTGQRAIVSNMLIRIWKQGDYKNVLAR